MSISVIIAHADIAVGAEVPPLVWRPSREQLFRFSAVTWNPHRIHYDRDAALAEGYPDIVVQAHLHGAALNRMVMNWIGPRGRIRSLAWQNRAIATPDDTLVCSGIVVKKELDSDRCTLWLELAEKAGPDRLCAAGSAVVEIPLRPAAQDGVAAVES